MLIDFSYILNKHPTVFTTLFAALMAGIFAALALRHNIKSSKVKNSLDFESTYKHNDNVVASTLEIKKILRNRLNVPIEDWGLEKNALSHEANHISTVMNEWERCANAIYHDIYDDDFLYGTYGSTVIFLFTHLNPYILKRQEHNSRVYTKFCWLAVSWKIRRDNENNIKIESNLFEVRQKLQSYLSSLK